MSSDRNVAERKAWFVGGGIGSLSGAVFLVRDGGLSPRNITIFEELRLNGGSCDGIGNGSDGYVIRGGRMLNAPTYECTWELFKGIPSVTAPGKSVYEETMEFNARVKTFSKARLVDRNLKKVDVNSMGFSSRDRMELLRIIRANEDKMGDTRISDWFSPHFFTTSFWFMWATTFAFQPWHSAAELKRYLLRFMHEFPRIQTLAGVTRTTYNQYDSLVLPVEKWLKDRGVQFRTGVRVNDLDLVEVEGKTAVRALHLMHDGREERLVLGDDDLVFLQNGSMTEASSLGSMTSPPPPTEAQDGGSWKLWERLAAASPEFGNPRVFSDRIVESVWESFTVTLKNSKFFDAMAKFSGNQAGTGALVTFKDSNWLMSVVLAYQPHFRGQPEGVQVFWGYGLFPDRVGNFVAKKMSECTGEEILRELVGHLKFDYDDVFQEANCIPCLLPFITSQFLTRQRADRPLPVPRKAKNWGLISQFVEIPDDVVFTVEYSIRAAQIAVYELLGLKKKVPPVNRHDRTFRVRWKSLITAYR